MRKMLKKIVSFVALAALVMFMGTVGNAEASSCPPHGPYVERMMDGCYQWREYHTVAVTVIGTNEYGEQIPVYDSNGNPLTVKCLKSCYRYHIGIYCDGCLWFLNDYRYETPIVHSYCAVG